MWLKKKKKTEFSEPEKRSERLLGPKRLMGFHSYAANDDKYLDIIFIAVQILFLVFLILAILMLIFDGLKESKLIKTMFGIGVLIFAPVCFISGVILLGTCKEIIELIRDYRRSKIFMEEAEHHRIPIPSYLEELPMGIKDKIKEKYLGVCKLSTMFFVASILFLFFTFYFWD